MKPVTYSLVDSRTTAKRYGAKANEPTGGVYRPTGSKTIDSRGQPVLGAGLGKAKQVVTALRNPQWFIEKKPLSAACTVDQYVIWATYEANHEAESHPNLVHALLRSPIVAPPAPSSPPSSAAPVSPLSRPPPAALPKPTEQAPPRDSLRLRERLPLADPLVNVGEDVLLAAEGLLKGLFGIVLQEVCRCEPIWREGEMSQGEGQGPLSALT
jgi:hypothetical protein